MQNKSKLGVLLPAVLYKITTSTIPKLPMPVQNIQSPPACFFLSIPCYTNSSNRISIFYAKIANNDHECKFTIYTFLASDSIVPNDSIYAFKMIRMHHEQLINNRTQNTVATNALFMFRNSFLIILLRKILLKTQKDRNH